jgi:hypothetical protein
VLRLPVPNFNPAEAVDLFVAYSASGFLGHQSGVNW